LQNTLVTKSMDGSGVATLLTFLFKVLKNFLWTFVWTTA